MFGQHKQGKEWWLNGKPSVTFSQAYLESKRTEKVDSQINLEGWHKGAAAVYCSSKEDLSLTREDLSLPMVEPANGGTMPSITISSPSSNLESSWHGAVKGLYVPDSSPSWSTSTKIVTHSLSQPSYPQGVLPNTVIEAFNKWTGPQLSQYLKLCANPGASQKYKPVNGALAMGCFDGRVPSAYIDSDPVDIVMHNLHSKVSFYVED